MKIALDVMGGDYAPVATVKGAILALKEIEENTTIVLIGDKIKIEEICQQEGVESSQF